jgi:TatD DNase family protein
MDMVLAKGISCEQIFDSMKNGHVERFIQIAADREALDFVDQVNSQQHPAVQLNRPIDYTIGMHPGEVHERDTQFLKKEIHNRSNDKYFRAVGEIGLDYFYGSDYQKEQLIAFEEYLEAAALVNKPVCIHTRDAHEDTLKLLTKYTGQLPAILIHCFTGGVNEIKDYLSIGCFISFSGIVTFKSAIDNKEAAKICPLDRILIETDAPYLAPVPHRGKVNHPGYLPATLEYVAALKEIPAEELGQRTVENTVRLYQL